MKQVDNNILWIYRFAVEYVRKFDVLPLLFIRLVLAYGFFTPAIMKWKDIQAIGDWLGQLGIPFPHFNAYLAATTEFSGVILLTLGFATRFISVPLMVTMLVAIKTVHLEHGFDAANNGFEIPLYYLIMLLTLFVYGGGKLSADYFLFGRRKA